MSCMAALVIGFDAMKELRKEVVVELSRRSLELAVVEDGVEVYEPGFERSDP